MKNNIFLYIFNISNINIKKNFSESWKKFFTHKEITYAKKKTNRKIFNQHIISRYILKKIISKKYNIAFNNLHIISKKKPYFIKYQQIQFNISHSKNYIAIIIMVNKKNRYLGIDIEENNRIFINNKINIIKRFLKYFCINDINKMEKNSFFVLWTQYESIIKSFNKIGNFNIFSYLKKTKILKKENFLYKRIKNFNIITIKKIRYTVTFSFLKDNFHFFDKDIHNKYLHITNFRLKSNFSFI